MLGGSGGEGAAENGEMTDAHTEKLGLVVLCSLIETPASGKQRVYYTVEGGGGSANLSWGYLQGSRLRLQSVGNQEVGLA